MKIKIDTTFVFEIDPTLPEEAESCTELTLKHIILASCVQVMEETFQAMLMQQPELLKAEVVNVEEV